MMTTATATTIKTEHHACGHGYKKVLSQCCDTQLFFFNRIILIILMLYFRVFATAFKRFSCVR